MSHPAHNDRISSHNNARDEEGLAKHGQDGSGSDFEKTSQNTLYGTTTEQQGEVAEVERGGADYEKSRTEAGEAKFKRLGWKRLTVVLIVEAIALGCLGLPQTFATLGMVPATIISVGIGCVAIYTSYLVGLTKIKFPHVTQYADAGRLLAGSWGYEIISAMFVLQLTFLVGSHCLTGTIALNTITSHPICSVIFGIVSTVLLFVVALPPSFSEVAILGYVDFVSIITAVLITMIATGIQSSEMPNGLHSVDWSAWPKPNLTFTEAFVAVGNIVFAYSFAICQFSFMDEMHTPKDFIKSIWALGLIEIVIYTCTGAIIYSFVGPDVKSPALLSGSPLIQKVAFGVALPVIFISGSINATVVARYIHGRVYKDSVTRYINTPKGWLTWIGLVAVICLVGFVIAEAIPFFDDLLSISSALFISGFSFYFPSWMWFKLLREGSLWERKNLKHTIANIFVTIIGLVTLVGGTYAAVDDIANRYADHSVRGAFACGEI